MNKAIVLIGLVLCIGCLSLAVYGWYLVVHPKSELLRQATVDADLPKGYYRIGYDVFNSKSDYVGIWIDKTTEVTFENCQFEAENK